MKPVLFFYCSSHAKRLCSQAKLLTKITQQYTVQEFTKSGATVMTLSFPNLQHLTNNDILLVQISGNSLFKRNIEFQNINGKRIIHLKSFCPQDQATITQETKLLKEHLRSLTCKIYVIDQIYRHLYCCSKHFDNRIYRFQKRQNTILSCQFKDITNVRVINHLKFLNRSKNWLTSYPNVIIVNANEIEKVQPKEVFKQIVA